MTDIKQKIFAKLEECYSIAKKKTVELPHIEVRFDLKGYVAGMFCYQKFLDNRYFRFNLPIAEKQIDAYLARTVPHEFAHYVVNECYSIPFPNRRFTSHCYEWKRTMINMFGLEPTTYHSYDTTEISINKKRIAYYCGCMDHMISSVRHNRILSGTVFVCAKCKEIIKIKA